MSLVRLRVAGMTGDYVASTRTRKVHESSCHFADFIADDVRVEFEDIDEAEDQGYERALCCCEPTEYDSLRFDRD